jgi:DNA repair protein RadC
VYAVLLQRLRYRSRIVWCSSLEAQFHQTEPRAVISLDRSSIGVRQAERSNVLLSNASLFVIGKTAWNVGDAYRREMDQRDVLTIASRLLSASST